MANFTSKLRARLEPIREANRLERERVAAKTSAAAAAGSDKQAHRRNLTSKAQRIRNALTEQFFRALQLEPDFAGSVADEFGGDDTPSVRLIIPGSDGPKGYIVARTMISNDKLSLTVEVDSQTGQSPSPRITAALDLSQSDQEGIDWFERELISAAEVWVKRHG